MSLKQLVSDLWQVPAYLPYLQPPLDAAAERLAQRSLGVRLPRAYLAALRVQNGGYLRWTFPELPHRELWGLGPGPHTLNGFAWEESILSCEDAGAWIPRSHELLLPFDGDGHWFLCFDYRRVGRRGEPSIRYVDLECGEERRVARHFVDFLEKLCLEERSAVFGIATRLAPAAAAARLGAALDVPLTAGGADLYSYPHYSASLGTRDEPAWVSLHPNRVQRGYWPAGRARPRGAPRLPGTATIWPEAPEAKLIVTACREVETRVAEACAAAFGHAPLVIG